ncbi:NnrS family protein [Oxalobacteraceae bacterium OM1]|nr:NnrS family protein [Oxalobacteraceae bacterium OM1]
MSLLTIQDPAGVPDTGPRHALFALGFRPFYLLAAAFAGVSIPLWLASYYGWSAFPHVALAWHVHEMVFGFVIAVVIGFLYTAGRNWTGLWTPRGKALAALAVLWIAGRAAMLFAPPVLAALIDFAFLPAAAWPLYRVLKRSGNKRNMVLVGLLALLTLANGVFHAAALGVLPVSPLQPVYAAIMVIVIIEAVIGGRVIPNFTANAVKGSNPVQNAKRDRISMAFTAAAAIAWVAGFPAPATAALAIAAAVAQATRLIGWKPLCTLRNPLLWILHLSYAWIPLGFVMLALSQLGVVPQSAAVHLLAVGAIAGLILGMITRTALGHTGRMLKAGPAETAMYVLIQCGVALRLVAAMASGELRDVALLSAAGCWSAAFAVYVLTYAPYLFRPRVDGKEG